MTHLRIRNSNSFDDDMSYDDMYDMFNTLHVKYKIVNKEKKKLRKGNTILIDTLEKHARTIHENEVCIYDLHDKLEAKEHSISFEHVLCDHVNTIDALQI